ncbi:MAG: DUF5665 domain-containing protein [bacterium]|nr:DUF5665 domain-containing protein [bacterium]
MSANKDKIVPLKKRTEKQYAELGKAVSTVFESGAISKKALYKASLLRGLFSGIGGVIGATAGIALFLWLLSLFDQVPLIGTLLTKLQETINSTTK